MRPFRLRRDLQRARIDGFALPLGWTPGRITAPEQGYTIDYTPGEGDDPDSYSFYVVVSHERVRPILERLFQFLPNKVHGIVEIGSRDAYRPTDVFMAQEPVSRERFLQGWLAYRDILVEEGSIGCGANGDAPFVEVFLDTWKGISVHVPLTMRDAVESLLRRFDLEEVPETWPHVEDSASQRALRMREVLDLSQGCLPGVDELLLELRQAWNLELNVDPDTNVDGAGRELGSTLWHATVLVEPADGGERAGYASIWATARSLSEMEAMIEAALAEQAGWYMEDIFTIDRVAYDERPDELTDLSPRRDHCGVHLLVIEA